MRFDTIYSHIERADKAANSFDKFGALWDAFNVMYEHKREELINITRNRNPSERNTAKFCANFLPYDSWIDLFPSRDMSNLFAIAPIFNVRDMLRKSEMNTREFDELLNLNLTENTGDPDVDSIKFNALIDLLYIVRCNKYHGFKTVDRPRDVEVLDTTTPLLNKIVTRLVNYFEDNE